MARLRSVMAVVMLCVVGLGAPARSRKEFDGDASQSEESSILTGKSDSGADVSFAPSIPGNQGIPASPEAGNVDIEANPDGLSEEYLEAVRRLKSKPLMSEEEARKWTMENSSPAHFYPNSSDSESGN